MASRKGVQHATNIMSALAEAPRPLSAYDLLDRLRPTGVAAPLTVYRALDKLIASGKVHRIESLNAFVACRNGEHAHSHAEDGRPGRAIAFTICDRCGTVEEFADDAILRQCDGSLRASGFQARSSTTEVHGLCHACAALPPRHGAEPSA